MPPLIPLLVDTLDAARKACERLCTMTLLALDVEWEANHAQIALLQLACSPSEIYVFDVLALGQRLFDAEQRLLLPILCDPSIVKLCFDCRGDASVLLKRHRVQMHGVYDLQIVYASLFAHKHGDGHLRGLHRALEHALDPEEARVFAQRKLDQRARRFFDTLRYRPLSAETIEYAANDVAHLFALHSLWYPHFSKRAVLLASTRRMRSSLYETAATTISKSRIDFLLMRPLRLAFVYRNLDDANV